MILHGTILPSLPGSRYVSRPAYERDTQTEFDVGYRTRNAVTEFEYGIRYVNDIAHFSRTGTLADRTTACVRT